MNTRLRAGVMISEAPFLNLPVLFQQCGLDFVLIDTEHGAFDWSVLSGLIMNAKLCGLTAIVRLADNRRRDITRLMDMGADGLLLPMTDGPEQIEQVVRFAKYAPLGRRGLSTTRAHTLYNPPELAKYMAQANEHTRIFAQIETARGLEQVERILAVEGVCGVMVGPNDLACDLGCLGEEEPICRAIRRVGDAVRASGKEGGIITGAPALLACARESGLSWFSIGSELNMLKTGAISVVRKVEKMKTMGQNA